MSGDDLRSIAKLYELEAALLDAKEAKDTDPERYAQVKREVRERRQYWRGIRDAVAAPGLEGDAIVRPGTVI